MLRRLFGWRKTANKDGPVPTLERVFGLTASSGAAVAYDRNTNTIAYPAGCVVVLYNPTTNQQTHISHPDLKKITCLAFSFDGKYLTTGEEGQKPKVRVWNVQDKTLLAELKGHENKVNCVGFHPSGKYVVSVGCQHDKRVQVWNWQKKVNAVVSNKEESEVLDLTFSENGNIFVTAGRRHIKFWYLTFNKSRDVPLKGFPVDLRKYRQHAFSGVSIRQNQDGTSHVFCVSKKGFLLEINNQRRIVRVQNLKVPRAYCVRVSGNHVYVGCHQGIILIFSTETLEFRGKLPLPHHIGMPVGSTVQNCYASKEQAKSSYPDVTNYPDVTRYPDVIALAVGQDNLCAVHSDRGLYVWDVTDPQQAGRVRQCLFHGRTVWDIDVFSNADIDTGSSSSRSFVTCSADDTVRLWSLFEDTTPKFRQRSIVQQDNPDLELKNIIYAGDDLSNITASDVNEESQFNDLDQDIGGVRCVRVSPDNKHLALGFRQGYIRIFDLSADEWIIRMQAHKSDVLCLEFTDKKAGVNLLASGGRDGSINIFDCGRGYCLLQTLEQHPTSVWSVCFLKNKNKLELISCGADRSLQFSSTETDRLNQFTPCDNIVGPGAFYDMCVDTPSIITAGQDRYVRMYDTETRIEKKPIRISGSKAGSLIKAQVDPSTSYVGTSSSNNSIELFGIQTGDRVATLYGHSMFATGVRFLNDCKHLVTVSGDGCIFVWRLPEEYSRCIRQRMKDSGKIAPVPRRRLSLRRRAESCPNLHPRNTKETLLSSSGEFGPNHTFSEVDTNAAPQQNGNGSSTGAVADLPTLIPEDVNDEDDETEILDVQEPLMEDCCTVYCDGYSEEKVQDEFFQQYYNFSTSKQVTPVPDDETESITNVSTDCFATSDICSSPGDLETVTPLDHDECLNTNGFGILDQQTAVYNDIATPEMSASLVSDLHRKRSRTEAKVDFSRPDPRNLRRDKRSAAYTRSHSVCEGIHILHNESLSEGEEHHYQRSTVSSRNKSRNKVRPVPSRVVDRAGLLRRSKSMSVHVHNVTSLDRDVNGRTAASSRSSVDVSVQCDLQPPQDWAYDSGTRSNFETRNSVPELPDVLCSTPLSRNRSETVHHHDHYTSSLPYLSHSPVIQEDPPSTSSLNREIAQSASPYHQETRLSSSSLPRGTSLSSSSPSHHENFMRSSSLPRGHSSSTSSYNYENTLSSPPQRRRNTWNPTPVRQEGSGPIPVRQRGRWQLPSEMPEYARKMSGASSSTLSLDSTPGNTSR